MFMGYSITNWLELGLYSVFVLLLFIGSGLLSCFIVNKFLHKKRNKLKKNKKKKSYFIDVA